LWQQFGKVLKHLEGFCEKNVEKARNVGIILKI
jgi:hypothetical protein